MGRGVNTGALSPVGGIGEIRMRANLRKIVADKYENADFIASDPVQFPRRYSGRDAEVSGFITSWLSFGNRKAIIGAEEMRKCLDKIFDLAIDERLK